MKGNFLFFKDNFFWRCAIFLAQWGKKIRYLLRRIIRQIEQNIYICENNIKGKKYEGTDYWTRIGTGSASGGIRIERVGLYKSSHSIRNCLTAACNQIKNRKTGSTSFFMLRQYLESRMIRIVEILEVLN